MRHGLLLRALLLQALLLGGAACSGEAEIIGGAGSTEGAGEEPVGGDTGGDTATAGAGSGPEAVAPEASGPSPGEPPREAGGEPTPEGADPSPEQPTGAEPVGPVAPEVAFIAPRGPCPLGARVGSFAIEKQSQFGVVQGAVADGVVPTAIPRLAHQDGACRLLERRTLACIPACVGAETCGEDGACIPYPRQVSVGEVTIAGLTRPTTMAPLQPGNSYFSPGADNPPYAVGSEIVLSAVGEGEREPFSLFGVGTEPLAQAPTWQLQAGADLAVTWPAPSAAVAGSGVVASVSIELTIDQHGASPLTLSCEVPDTGSAVVPAAIIDRMIDSGVSGFPNGRLMRRTTDHVYIGVDLDVDLGGGCVELVVGSPLAANVSVSGFTPCNGTAECPSGQVCNVALQRCE